MELCKSKSISVFEIRRNVIIHPPEFLQAKQLVSITLLSRQFQIDDLDLNNKKSIKELKDNCVEVLIKNASFHWDRKLNIKEIFDVDSYDYDELDSDDEKRIETESVNEEVHSEDEKTIDIVYEQDGSDNNDEEEESDVPLLDNKTIQGERLIDNTTKENEWNESEIDKLQLVVHNKK